MHSLITKTLGLGALLCAAIVQAEPQYSADYNSCLDQAAGVTANMLGCIAAELTVQDKKLNANYKLLKEGLELNRQQQLLEVQRLWLKYRDANCKFYDDPTGGSMQKILAQNCFLRLTAQRAHELTELRYPM
jgi:uncharacterized protein YecT (DUF1311 family)